MTFGTILVYALAVFCLAVPICASFALGIWASLKKRGIV